MTFHFDFTHPEYDRRMTISCSFAIGWMMLGAQGSLEPNYAAALLPSRDGVPASIGNPWSRFPLRVLVIDSDPLYTTAYYEAIVRATSRWQQASGGMVSFSVRHAPSSGPCDITVRVRSNQELNLYGGYTTFPTNDGALVELSGTRTSGKPTELWLFERVATHELGHALGIGGHSPNRKDMMSLNYHAVDITRADVNTLRMAYQMARQTPAP